MPIYNPTIQLVVVDLCTKYEDSIVNGCGDIFDEKVLRNYGRKDGRTDGRTDGTTDRCKPVYPPLFQSGGIKIFHVLCKPLFIWYFYAPGTIVRGHLSVCMFSCLFINLSVH